MTKLDETTFYLLEKKNIMNFDIKAIKNKLVCYTVIDLK